MRVVLPRLGGGRACRLLASVSCRAGSLSVMPASELASLPSRWVIFSDLHVRQDSLPYCLQLLRLVAEEARSSRAGVICLGDFWHAGAVLSTRQLNAVLAEMRGWHDLRVLMIPGNHDQAMRGNPDPQMHALTPLQLAMPRSVTVFSRPTLVGDSLWIPYGIDEEGVRSSCNEAAALCEEAGRGGLAAVFCHADVVGGMMNDGVAAVRGIPPDAFPLPPVRVYSGHYHKPHAVPSRTARGRSIRYIGSPYQTSMAEAGQHKALLTVDSAAGWKVVSWQELDIGPRHHVLRAPMSTAKLSEVSASLRPADRVLILAPDTTAEELIAFADEARERGATVEVRTDANSAHETSRNEAAMVAAEGAPSQTSTDLLHPVSLWDKYAADRNLSVALVEAGRSLLEAAGAARQASGSADHVHVEMTEVVLDNFGSFGAPTSYPLERRGLVLLQGSNRAAHDAIAATALASADEGIAPMGSNGAGKTTLAMATLWALTGATDTRADGRAVESRGVIHDGAKRAMVTLRGNVRRAAPIASSSSYRAEGRGAMGVARTVGETQAVDPSRDAASWRREAEALRVRMEEARTALVEWREAEAEAVLRRAYADAEAAVARQVDAKALLEEATTAAAVAEDIAAAAEADNVVARKGSMDNDYADRRDRCTMSSIPFEVVRTIGRRDHRVSFRLGETLYDGTLAQVQSAMDEALRVPQLARSCFFGQHMGGGLLDKTDAALKAELQSLLPLDQWEQAREDAKSTAARYRESAARAAGSVGATVEAGDRAAAEAAQLEREARAWEAQRAVRERDLTLRLDEALRQMEASSQALRAAETAKAEAAAYEVQTVSAANGIKELGYALKRAQAAEVVRREEAERSWRLAREAEQGAAEAAATAVAEHSRALIAADAAAEALVALRRQRAALGWGKDRLSAAELLAAAGAASVDNAIRQALAASSSQKSEMDALAALEALALERRAATLAARQQAALNEPSCQGRDGDPGMNVVRVCESCGQEVTAAHQHARSTSLTSRLREAEEAERLASANLLAARTALDARRLCALSSECDGAKNRALQQRAIAEAAAEVATAAQGRLLKTRECLAEIEQSHRSAAQAAEKEIELARRDLETARCEAIAAQAATARVVGEIEKLAQAHRFHSLQCAQIEEKIAALRNETNPHALRNADAKRRQAEATAAIADAQAKARHDGREAATHVELERHLGRRGAQTRLFELATLHIESVAAGYASAMSAGRLKLRLRFEEQTGSVRKEVEVRRSDGSSTTRTVAQLSGGEWRRLGLALSLAYAQFAQARGAVSCNLLVLDEILGGIDAEGQGAVASVLRGLPAESILVIAHGLQHNTLYGEFDAIDTVERIGESSHVLVGDCEMLGIVG